MKTFLHLLLLTSAFTISACTLQVKTNDDSGSSGKIRNGIELQENGLHAEQAYLMLEDGSLLAESNKVQVGQNVVMRLVTSGWQDADGRIYPEASEKISTNEGTVLLDEAALFEKGYPDGIEKENAKNLTLSAVIKSIDKLHDYYLVSFKLWDKKTGKSLSGTYKLHI